MIFSSAVRFYLFLTLISMRMLGAAVHAAGAKYAFGGGDKPFFKRIGHIYAHWAVFVAGSAGHAFFGSGFHTEARAV